MTSLASTILRDGAVAELGAILAARAVRSILFVVDQMAYHATGADSIVEPILARHDVTRFTGFEPNPKLADVERGIDLARQSHPDCVIALGGGTAIDLAKMIAAMSVQTASARDIAQGNAPLERPGPSLIAIPTTAGTGSEATHFAVLYVDGKKTSIAHPDLLPDVAIVDPGLTLSLPPSLTAATGLDAFCQAVESIWSVAASDASLDDATRAARLAWTFLPRAVHDRTPEARHALCEASHLAGRAINRTKTTLPHALSYTITSEFGVPHGLAVAVTLAPVLAYNAAVSEEDCVDPRGPAAVRERISLILDALSVATVEDACHAIESFLTDLGCPTSVAGVGIDTPTQRRHLAEQVNAERLSNNPRRIDTDGLVALLTPRTLDQV